MASRWFPALLLAASLLTANAPAHDAHHPRGSLLRADDELARAMQYAGPVDGLIRNAAHDISYLHPGAEILTGRLNALGYLRTVYSVYKPNVRTTLHRLAGDASVDGTLGYTFGWLDETRTIKETGVTETAYGRYAAVWRRGERDWEVEVFLRLGGSAPLPAPPADALIVDGEPGVKLRDHPESHALNASIADARFADLSLAQGYSIAFDKYAADAAIVITSGGIYWNRAGVNEAFAGWSPDQSLRWHPLRAGAAASGDLAWTIGHGSFFFGLGTGSEGVAPSKYLTVWLRTPTGWRFLIDGGSSRPGDPAP